MKTILCATSVALCLAACSSTPSTQWADFGERPMEDPRFLAAMTEAGTPGTEHARLASRQGRWAVDGRFWNEPGDEPTPMPATAEVEVWLDGRYVVETFESDFMGMPFEGRLLQGYDNVRERYWCIWIDSMSTGQWTSFGRQTAPGVVEYEGVSYDVLTPAGRPTRMQTIDDNDGTYTMRMYDTTPEGEEFLSMELTYSRP